MSGNDMRKLMEALEPSSKIMERDYTPRQRMLKAQNKQDDTGDVLNYPKDDSRAVRIFNRFSANVDKLMSSFANQINTQVSEAGGYKFDNFTHSDETLFDNTEIEYITNEMFAYCSEYNYSDMIKCIYNINDKKALMIGISPATNNIRSLCIVCTDLYNDLHYAYVYDQDFSQLGNAKSTFNEIKEMLVLFKQDIETFIRQ